ncbi:MAG: helix-turn-helix transcriptional regulator [Muribaculaceae bacterium]|nr:helix-turn-helix transcriptional regulator [Muribaculaceae bacterium]
MNELVIEHVRSLLYGAIIGIIINCIVSLFIRYNKRESDRTRFVIGITIVCNLWLLLQYVAWFFIDSLNLYKTVWWDTYKVSETLNFIEMSSLPLSIASLISVSRLRNTSTREILAFLAPIALLAVLYFITSWVPLIYMGYVYVAATSVVAFFLVKRNVKHFNTLLSETYANTSKRDISWVFTVLYILMFTFIAWTVMAIIYPTVLGDCIYMAVSIIVTSVFVHMLCHQELDVHLIIEMSESENEDSELDDTEEETEVEATEAIEPVAPAATQADDTTMVQVSQMVSEVPLPQVKVKLKAWQEPRFDAAVRNYCNKPEVFTNPDLSVQDVATGVGSNRTYVSRWCKENEKDFSTYITNIRLDYAEKLVARTTQPISEIVEDSGFSNARHFRNVFVTRYGCTPSEYRAKQGML